MQERIILNRDVRLFTLFQENKGKETVILLHGGPGVPENMDSLVKELSKNYQIIYFHQRGTLKSPCITKNFSIARHIADLDRVAAFFRIERFHLFGHSWGGLYAQIYAAERREKILSLFLCSPATGTGKQWGKMSLEVNHYHRTRSSFWEWVGLQKNAILGILGMEKPFRKFYSQFAKNCNKDFNVEKSAPLLIDHATRDAGIKTGTAILKHPKLPRLARPGFRIVVTYGDQDIFGKSIEYVQKRYPTASFHTIKNCGHMHWLHNPADFYRIFRNHFRLPNI